MKFSLPLALVVAQSYLVSAVASNDPNFVVSRSTEFKGVIPPGKHKASVALVGRSNHVPLGQLLVPSCGGNRTEVMVDALFSTEEDIAVERLTVLLETEGILNLESPIAKRSDRVRRGNLDLRNRIVARCVNPAQSKSVLGKS